MSISFSGHKLGFSGFKFPTARRRHRVALTTAAMALLIGYSATELSASANANNNAMLNLDHYQKVAPPIALTMTHGNASGLTYNPDTNSLFAVVNGPELLIELDKNGKEIRLIELKGFDDTEGVVYLGDKRYAIIEEDRRSIAIATIGELTRWVYREDAQLFSLPLTSYRNKGFEGISYDPSSDTLIVVNEKKPRAIYRISGLTDNQRSISVSSPWDLENQTLGSTDFSGIHYHAESGNLLLLSDESKKISEVMNDGSLLSEYSFNEGLFGTGQTVPQPEGITMDDDGTLYILSEPNLLYRYQSEKRLTPSAS